MGRLQRLGLTFAVVGAVAACGGDRVVPVASGSTPAATMRVPSAAATAGSAAIDPQASEATAGFSSTRFAYSIEYPAGWAVRHATDDWPTNGFPEPDGTATDRFAATPDSATWMFVSSLVLADGDSGAGIRIKAKDMDDVRIGEMDSEFPLMCEVSPKVAVTVDGVAGRGQDLEKCFQRDYLTDVLVSNDIRLYFIAVLNPGPIDAATRSRFERFVGSFRFRM